MGASKTFLGANQYESSVGLECGLAGQKAEMAAFDCEEFFLPKHSRRTAPLLIIIML